MEIPAGNVENPEQVYSVRMAAKYSSLNELRNTVIATTPNGGKIKIMDVAEVEDGVAEQKLINRIDGKDAIGISIQKQSDANAVLVADMAKQELKAVEKEYAANDVKFDIATDDSVYTNASAHSVVIDLVLAILIVAFVCFIFLHNVRSALIVMVAVPLSIIPAFIGMYLLGYSLNMMSLMALSLVVGILVDDSIVVIENMFTHMEKGKTKWQAAIDGCKQIMFTAMAITIVIVVVFLPLALSGGMIGNVLKEFATPIIIATLCSLLVSFTVTPLLMSRFGNIPDDARPARHRRPAQHRARSPKIAAQRRPIPRPRWRKNRRHHHRYRRPGMRCLQVFQRRHSRRPNPLAHGHRWPRQAGTHHHRGLHRRSPGREHDRYVQTFWPEHRRMAARAHRAGQALPR
jgi:multidrug efflux pump subunit AcrB